MNEEEYIETAKNFRATIREEFSKPREKRDVPDEWLDVKAESICRNEKCPVFEVVFKVTVSENADGVYRVVCGRCSTWVWDLTPIFDDGPGERLAVSKDDPRAETAEVNRSGNGREGFDG